MPLKVTPKIGLSLDEARALYSWMKHEYIPHDDNYHIIVKALSKLSKFISANNDK